MAHPDVIYLVTMILGEMFKRLRVVGNFKNTNPNHYRCGTGIFEMTRLKIILCRVMGFIIRENYQYSLSPQNH